MSELDEGMSRVDELLEEVKGEKERADRLEAMVDRMAGTIVDKDAEIFKHQRQLVRLREYILFLEDRK